MFSTQCTTGDPPRVVLDKLSKVGYALVSQSCGGDYIHHSWTLFKPEDNIRLDATVPPYSNYRVKNQ